MFRKSFRRFVSRCGGAASRAVPTGIERIRREYSA